LQKQEATSAARGNSPTNVAKVDTRVWQSNYNSPVSTWFTSPTVR